MNNEIHHRRLYAFNNSKVLSALTVVIVVGLCLFGCCESWLPAIACVSTSVILYAGYSIWLWFCKPNVVIINRRLADLRFYFVLYALLVAAMRAHNLWWYVLPLICAIVLLFFSMLRSKDEIFVINGRE